MTYDVFSSGLLRSFGKLYAATLDESQWRNFLAGLCETTSSVIGFLIRNDSAKGRQVLASAGEEPPPEFDRGYTTADPVQSVEALLESSDTATLMLSPSGKLLHLNQAARTLITSRDGLVERKGQICPTCIAHRSEFEGLVARAANANDSGGAMMLERGGNKRPLQILISPLFFNGVKLPRRVLVLASDPDHHPQFPDTVLKKLYGFTHAETDLANGFLTGLSPEAIAVVRGVSLETVRSQIKSLLAKTNTQRQVDLVRLLYALPRVGEH